MVTFTLIMPSLPQAAVIDPFSKIDPSFKFWTVETEHFKVHYHEGLEDIAKKTAAVAEEAHCVLSPAFGWKPSEKTHIALIDNTDFANGLASVVPFNFIYIYPVPPMPDMSIGKYDDWLRMLVFHEYTHILTMDPVRGYSKAMRTVFGKTYPGFDPLSTALFLLTAPPNIFLPYWWVEGVPTWAETEYTRGGRGRSSYYEMFFRMAVAEENILTVDKINGDIPYWPGGGVPYIYGLAFQRYIAKAYGPDAPGKLSLAHSGRIPFLINRPPEDLADMDYESLYYKTIEDLWEDQKAKLKLLRASPLTPFDALPLEGEILTNPRYSKDGKMLAVNRRDPHGHEGVVIYGSGKELLSVRRLPSDRHISWAPDGSGFYFTQAELRGGYNLYQDIYFYDIAAGKAMRITKDMRFKDPDMSPDGKTLAFVITQPRSQNLALLDTEVRRLTDFSDMRLSSPRWSPDGRMIVFSVRDNAGKTALCLYNLDTGSLERLLENEADNISPVWSPEGDFIIYSSDMTGVYNLLAFSLPERRTYQVTHLLGGAFAPDISPDGKKIAFSSYGSRGFKIAEMDYDPTAFKEELGPSIKPYWPGGESGRCAESRIAELTGKERNPGDEKSPAGPVRYSALGTLLPRFWLPTLNVYDDESVLGVFTGGRDLLGYHTYFLNGGVGLKRGRGYYDLRYIYDRYYPTLELRGYKKPDNSFDEKGLISSLTFPLRRLESGYSLRLGYHIKEEIVSENSVFATFLFSNALRYPYSISPEEGRTVSLSVIDYSELWGGDIDYREYVATYGEYVGLGGHNVLFLKLSGGTSGAASLEMGGFDEELGEFPLRGYPQISGFKNVATLSLEYRFPLEYILSGNGTAPVFSDRFHMAIFTDMGAAWNKDFDAEDIKVGAGAEGRLDLVLGYKLHITPSLGIASGLSRGGEDRVYIRVYVEGI